MGNSANSVGPDTPRVRDLITAEVYQYRCLTDKCVGKGPNFLSFKGERYGKMVFLCRECGMETEVYFQGGCRRDFNLIYSNDEKGR